MRMLFEMIPTTLTRLTSSDPALARETFRVMAEVFDEGFEPLGDAHLLAMLRDPRFWAFAAVEDRAVVGGVTAHALPMTRAPRLELMLFDIAVIPARQRSGVGRALVSALRASAREAGIADTFVLADEEDTHALDFYRALGGTASRVVMFDL